MGNDHLDIRGNQAAWTAARQQRVAAVLERFAEPTAAATSPSDSAVPTGDQLLVGASSHGGDWRVDEIPARLRDRRVELHVPPAAAAIDAALRGPAGVVQVSLESALPAGGLTDDLTECLQPFAAASNAPSLVFGPRNLWRQEPAVRWQGEPAPAGLVDTVLFLTEVAPGLAESGHDVCLRLPGIRSANDAALWCDICEFIEEGIGLSPGSTCFTVGIDCVSAVFASDAILHELQTRAVALTVDRHACLQSVIRSFPDDPRFVLPDRAELSTNAHFLRCWGQVVIATAHRRGASAIGPCASYLSPGGDDDEHVLLRLQADKQRHAHDGFDGSGVVDPALCGPAREVFDRLMPGQHQQHRCREDLRLTGADLLQVQKGRITEAGVRRNIGIALRGLLAAKAGQRWLDHAGRRETTAGIELAADQLWQWLHLETGVLDDGRVIDDALFRPLLDDVVGSLDGAGQAARRLAEHVNSPDLPPPLLAALAET